MTIKYKKLNNIYYFTLNDIHHFPIKIKQLKELSEIFHKLYNKEKPIYSCFCNIEDNDDTYQSDGFDCVFDDGNHNNCSIALQIKKKEECKYWKQIK